MVQQNWGTRQPLSGRIFTKVVLEAPLITESALEVIRKYCEDEVRQGSRLALSPASWRGRSPARCGLWRGQGPAWGLRGTQPRPRGRGV